ncbi:hypothetical protein L596_016273 [Steinernema carpocapsae]|uniref:Uncharacterized protein n=1 Tax=Steinernema carpocapsae TaxID=34508 RepID=A0A4U5NIH8_STECR|nr:hypothetical protein L596_016273 [Steinernema carpocapsae]
MKIANSSSDKSGKDAKAELIEDEPDNHILMSKNDNLTRHERFLIHLPIQQIEMNRSERNQRLVMLYGISDEREHATVTPRKVADNIVKIWQKKVNLEVPDLPPLPKTIVDASAKEVMNNREPKFRRKPAETYAECIATFKTQTYYDQHVIAAMCAESFIDMFRDFVSKGSSSHVIPTSESLDVLFYLMEYCQNINEIISISIELIPLLIAADDVLSQRQIPIIPGSLSAQHGYVITTYLSSHYQYFLMHPDAYKVLRGLFKLVEPQLRCKDRESCISAWARSISIFMLTAKMDLIKVNKDLVVVGKLSDLKSVFPSADVPSSPPKYSNGDRESAFSEMMKDLKLRRFMNYFDFKKKLSLLGQPGAGVSLVVAAFTAARDCGRRVEVLSDIATLVAHFAANKSIEADIYVVIDELCCSQKCKDKILPSSSRLKTDDIENIYAMATLTALLAAKHCVSAHALIVRLLEGVFRPFTGGKPIPGADKLEHMYRGLLLGTFIISMLICGTELPFCVDPVKQEKPGDRMPSDIRGIRTLFIRELNDTLMPILSILFLVAEPDKGDDDRATARTAWFKAPQYTASIQPVLKAAIRSICEQDWVNQRVFELCEKGRLEMFAKLRNNSQSQKIIRLALRRKCERNLKEELIANAENTVRLFLTRLFSSMNVWNMRAIIYDLRLMIKENEKIEKSTHTAFTQHQMLHLYDNLTQTIAGSCREYFMTMSPDKEGLQPIKVGKGFQLSR